MNSQEISGGKIMGYIFFSLVCVLLFWDENNYVSVWLHYLFVPLKLYTTAIHEGWHALVTLVTGGVILEINLQKDGAGHVVSDGGIFLLISPAGYIGSAITGALLIISAKKEIYSRLGLFVVSLLIISLNMVYIDTYFSIAFLNSILVSVLIMLAIFKADFSQNLAVFFGTILAVDSFSDIKKIIFQMPYETDAGILAGYLGAKFLAIPIAVIFSTICMIIWYLSIRYVIKSK